MLSLSVPADFRVITVSATEIDVMWQDTNSTETGYLIERSTDGVNFSVIGSAPTDAESYEDGGLIPGTAYAYRLRTFSTTQVVYTEPASTVTVPNAPAVPTGVTALRGGGSVVNLTWSHAGWQTDLFRILRSQDGGEFEDIGFVAGDVTTFADGSALAEHGYSYQVVAGNTGGESPSVTTANSGVAATSSVPTVPDDGPATPGISVARLASNPQHVLVVTYSTPDQSLLQLEYKRSTDDNYRLAGAPLSSSAAPQTAEVLAEPGETVLFRLRAEKNGVVVYAFASGTTLTYPTYLSEQKIRTPSVTVSLDSSPPGQSVYNVRITGPYNGEEFSYDGYPLDYTTRVYREGLDAASGFFYWELIGGYGIPEWDPVLEAYTDQIVVSGPGASIKYSVAVNNGIDSSDWSTPVVLTAPGHLPALTATVSEIPGEPLKSRVTISGGDFSYQSPFIDAFGGWSVSLVKVVGGVPQSGVASIAVPHGTTSFEHSFDVDKGLADTEYIAVYSSEWIGSPPSSVVTTPKRVDVPATPTGLKVTMAENNRVVRLVWDNTPNNETSYTVEHAANPEFTMRRGTLTAGADVTQRMHRLRDNNLRSEVGVTFYYRVKANNSAGGSGWSDVATSVDTSIFVGFNGAKAPFFPSDGNRHTETIAKSIKERGNPIKLRSSLDFAGGFLWLLHSLDLNDDGIYDPYHPDPLKRDQPRSIRIFGYSWGGTTATKLSRSIYSDSRFRFKDVDRLALIDPVNVARGVSTEVFSNVHWLKNWYQRKLTGRRVEILGQTVYGAAVPSLAFQEQQINATESSNLDDREVDHFTIVERFQSDIEEFLCG